MAPVSRNLPEGHEALLVGGYAQTWVGTEAGERLSEARFERSPEVADTIVAGRTVEAVACGAALEQSGVQRVAEAQGVG